MNFDLPLTIQCSTIHPCHKLFRLKEPEPCFILLFLRGFFCESSKQQDGSNDETETYEMSGGGVKTLVSGLTNLVNAVMRRDDEVPEAREKRAPITVAELKDGIEDDYRRCYLWTGDIDPNLYDWDCVFTGVCCRPDPRLCPPISLAFLPACVPLPLA